MEKTTGKNANLKARESAEREYEKVKEQLQEWRFKPNKTPEDKNFIKNFGKHSKDCAKRKILAVKIIHRSLKDFDHAHVYLYY